MRDGSGGNPGTPGNHECVSCRFHEAVQGSNLTLTAKFFIFNNLIHFID